MLSPLATEPVEVTEEVSTSTPQQSPLATPAPAPAVPTPSSGMGSVAGRLIDVTTSQPMVNQNLSLPSVLCPPDVTEEADQREQCVYVIDDAFDPSVLTNQEGRFVFRDIKPGNYVLLVGNPTTKYMVLTNDFDEPLIWKVEANKVLELGDLVIELR